MGKRLLRTNTMHPLPTHATYVAVHTFTVTRLFFIQFVFQTPGGAAVCVCGSDDGFVLVFNEHGESIMGEDGIISKKPVYQTAVR